MHILLPTIEPWDIINPVKTAWDQLFAQKETNKKVINPYNRSLLTYPIIHATIKSMKKQERVVKLLSLYYYSIKNMIQLTKPPYRPPAHI